MNETILIIGIAVAVITLGVMIFLFLKNKSIEEVRRYCYSLFLYAEMMYGSGEGQKKFDYVVEKAYEYIPSWLKLFIKEEQFEETVQFWFDYITTMAKDYLDNGMLDHSAEFIRPEVSE